MDYREVLKAQTVLDRKYRIDRVIGAGGFGITYQAFDIGLAAPVAIKEYYPAQFGMRDGSLSVRPRTDGDRPLFERLRASFLREARTLAQFDHPAIVRVLSVFETHGTAYMVMRFESGASLKVWLKELNRAPTQGELDRLLGPLLDAIELMHRADFLHRDIAPDNIIVRSDGTPVLLDFGASRRVVTDMSGTLTGVVKQGYSPQEQYSSDTRSQGPWTDIYSLGATLYLAVTGRVPTEATARMLEDGMMPAAEGARGDYRDAFLDAIDAAMRLRPRERPQSVAEWREMLFDGADTGWYSDDGDTFSGGLRGRGALRVPASAPRSGPGDRSHPRGQSAPRASAPRGASAPRYADRTGPRSAPGAASAPRSGSYPQRAAFDRDVSEASTPHSLPVPPSMATRAADFALSTRGAIVLGIGAMLLGGSMLLAFESPDRRTPSASLNELSTAGTGITSGTSRTEVNAARLELERQAALARQQEEARKAAEAEARRQEAARQAELARQRDEARKAAEAEARRQEAARQAELARQRDEARKAAEAEARRQEAARQAELARQRDEARKAAEAEARRQEAARQAELARQQDEARKAAEAEARRQEAARQAELARQQEAARKAAEAEEARRQEAARQAELARQQEAARKAAEAEEARRQEAARQAELARQQEAARKAAEAEEARRQEAARQAELARQQKAAAEQQRVASAAAAEAASQGREASAARPEGQVTTSTPSASILFADPVREPGEFVTRLASSNNAVLVGGVSGRLKLWTDGRSELAEFPAAGSVSVTDLSVSEDGKHAVSGSLDGTIHIWDMRKRSLLHTLAGEGSPVVAVKYRSETRAVAVFANGKWVILHPGNGEVLLSGTKPGVAGVTAAQFADEGKIVFAALAEGAEGNVIEGWVPSDGSVTRVAARLVGHTGRVNTLAASPDGEMVASASDDGTVRLWQVDGAREFARLEPSSGAVVRALAFSATGALVAGTGADGTVDVWQASDGTRIASYRGTEDGLQAVVFNSDGAAVVAAGVDGAIRQWALPAAFVIKPPAREAKPEPVVAVVPKPRIERPSREDKPEPRRPRVKREEKPERRQVRERRERPAPPVRRAPSGRGSGGGGSGGSGGGVIRVPTF